MNATANTSKRTNSSRNGIQTLCRTLKIMFWLYLGCLILFWPSAFTFFRKMPDGWMVCYQMYRQVSEVPWYAFGLAAVAIGFLALAAVTFYQLLSLYEQGTIFSAGNVRLLRRLGWLATGFGVFRIVGPTMIVLWRQWLEPLPWALYRDLALHELVAGFLALLGSPWIMGGLFLLTISHIMLLGYKLHEEQELTV